MRTKQQQQQQQEEEEEEEEEEAEADLFIGADTIVCLDDREIMEKPLDREDAKRMLRQLSGREHSVMTALVFILPLRRPEAEAEAEAGAGGEVDSSSSSSSSLPMMRVESFVEKTSVRFVELDEEVISSYVATGEPMDKAGGYGIQGLASTFVQGIRGDYFNVVGFPVCRFASELARLCREKKL